MKRCFFLPLLSIILILSFGCSKEGPAGPVGATGPQGPQGPAGPQGTTNVTYSAWFATGTGWTATGAPNYGAEFLYDKAAPAVTQAIMDQGIVLAYMKGDPNLGGTEAAQIYPLPYSVGHPAGFLDTYDFVLNAAGNIRFLYKTDAPFFDETDLAAISYRYVVIPGSVAGGRGINGGATYEGYSADELKTMTYDQLTQLFNIPAEGTNIR